MNGVSATRHGVETRIDFEAMTALFEQAAADDRRFLFEHEVYTLLRHLGSETPPRCRLLTAGARPSDEELVSLPGDRVVLKIVSPYIIHKLDVGGVRIVPREPVRIRAAWRRMMYEVADSYAEGIERHPRKAPQRYRGLSGDALVSAITHDIRGVLMVEYLPPEVETFGSELLVGLRNSREFGMILTAGVGGTDAEMLAENFRRNRGIISASTELNDGEAFFDLFRRTVSYQVLTGKSRGQKRMVADEQLVDCFSALIEVANRYSPTNPETPFWIEELEINPFAFRDFMMVPLDGMCRFSRPDKKARAARPAAGIHSLLHPERIGIIGVSTSRDNFGRIILNNFLAHGYPKERITVVHPTAEAIDGVRCVPGLGDITDRLDLLVAAVGAEALPPLVDEILAGGRIEAVLLIAGGLGETRQSRALAEGIMARIDEGHRQGTGPVFLGGNSLGVISHPGGYDTWFITEERLAKQRQAGRPTSAFISQSGGFMATCLSRIPELDPAYLVSVGNQNDLTHGDFMHYFQGHPDLEVIAVYCEGFNDLDGIHFTRAVRQAVLAGKDVIFYKAGRTTEGKTATSSHTASVAGDYSVCESCLTQAGAMVASSFGEFTDLYLLARHLHGRVIDGNRVAALSSAGFEAVGMADNIHAEDFDLKMSALSRETRRRIGRALADCGLDHLVEIKNPLDLNVGATDSLYSAVIEALAADEGVDLILAGIIPLAPVISALERDLLSGRSLADLLLPIVAASPKPIVAVVAGGTMYAPFIRRLEEAGMMVFGEADRAVRTIGLYIQSRLAARNLRRRHGRELAGDEGPAPGNATPGRRKCA
jgi:acyl-CoA synthetase (NDP forming)